MGNHAENVQRLFQDPFLTLVDNPKEPLHARNYTQLNHLVSLAKWLSVRLRFKWFWVRVQLQSLIPLPFALLSLESVEKKGKNTKM